ncbi:hypothetical protein NQ176_g9437 [Zarea fungicola]|uniref:Uncharacterized protein n=1 Tax=Zarea fungicola TaxID=93591 RepID=A0ACC1MM73_9HYPO|nr:hypothetical protein NQ176_g9437 [Lecanicillium fungicola]
MVVEEGVVVVVAVEGGIVAKVTFRERNLPRPARATGMAQNVPPQAYGGVRKRKAEGQDNERLSKKLSLLNIEQDGYNKQHTRAEKQSASSKLKTPDPATDDDMMRLDDTKDHVYIYNIDEELEEDSEPEPGKVIFLPDIEKILWENRIPRHILANKDGELAGMQMVLYSDPKSLSVPEEKDGVRKAILESRRRIRARQAGIDIDNVSPAQEVKDDQNNIVLAKTGCLDLSEDIEMDLD